MKFLFVMATCALIGTGIYAKSGNSAFTGPSISVSNNNDVFPVKDLRIIAEREASQTTIIWQTFSEMNTVYFELEKSTDNIEFAIIYTVYSLVPNGNDGLYRFRDKRSGTETAFVYYRVKITDNQGHSYYSEVLNDANHYKAGISTSPNPFVTKINLSYKNYTEPVMNIRIFDTHGKIIKSLRQEIKGSSGNLVINDLGNLPAGVYFIELSDEKGLNREIRSLIK